MTVESKRTSYWEMAGLGFARGSSLFPLEHVLERLKLESQVHTEKTTARAIKDLWQSEGLKGLYAGSRANFIRRTGRETYNWPVMLSVIRIWKEIIPERYNKDNLLTNLATGFTMSLVQAGVTLPFERLFMEKAVHGGYLPFIRKMINSRQPIVYEGFQATWMRHSIVWNLFFLSNHASNSIVRTIDPSDVHPHLSYIGKALLTSNLVVGIGYPVEFLRNRVLLEPEILSKGTLSGVKTLFQRYKWAKLYRGAPIVLVHNFIQTLVFQPLIDKMNKT